MLWRPGFGARRRRMVAMGAAPAVALVTLLAVPACSDEEPPATTTRTLFSPQLPDGSQRAFPTAEGHGAAAKGGRGGTPIFVTNTNEDGPGSLRACLEAEGPRICIFRVSGTITLDKSSLVVTEPYLTIAGETAPGDGIAIRNGPEQIRPSFEVKAHDVIVRHVRFRPGPHAIDSCCSGAIGVYTENAKDVIFDHISASWGSDETMDSQAAERITVQWSIFSEPLTSGGPGKRNRARNMLLTYGGDFSVHHNLFAYSRFRNPQIAPAKPGSTTEIVNNVLYSPQWEYIIALVSEFTTLEANIIGNVKFTGENMINDRMVHFFVYDNLGAKVYLEDNWDEDYRPSNDMAEDLVVLPEDRKYIVDEPVIEPLVRAQPALEALEAVLDEAGATSPARDPVDLRVIEQVRNKTGGLVRRNPDDVGGWPELNSAVPPADRDADGMADDWERRWGLDPSDPLDGRADADGDGWTNLEEYLHELAGDGAGMGRGDGAASQ